MYGGASPNHHAALLVQDRLAQGFESRSPLSNNTAAAGVIRSFFYARRIRQTRLEESVPFFNEFCVYPGFFPNQ